FSHIHMLSIFICTTCITFAFIPISILFSFPTRRSSDLKVIPFAVNTVQHPIPTARRCYQLGKALRKAIDSYPEDLKVVIFGTGRSEEHTSELQSRENHVCRLLLEKKNMHLHNHNLPMME